MKWVEILQVAAGPAICSAQLFYVSVYLKTNAEMILQVSSSHCIKSNTLSLKSRE
jgi:hypothetical protein